MSIIPFDFHTISAVGRGRFLGGSFVHNSCQSMCYDARNKKYIVGFAMPGNVSALVRMKDLSFEEDAVDLVVTELPLDHCNDMVYDPDEHKIYVVGGNYWVAVVDPDTLSVERKIPVALVAWSIARYPNGDYFVHDGGRGERYTHDFSSCQTVSVNDREIVIEALHVPYRPKRGDWAGVWQGAICIDDVPYMIYNEMSLKTGDPVSFVLFSCEMGEKRTIYRAETGHEIESADFVDGKMMLAYNEPYRYGGCSWEMSEITTKVFCETIELAEIPQDIVTPVDVSGFVPDGYAMISANVSIKKNGSSWRQLPLVGNNGTCTTWIVKIEKNKVYLRSRSAMTAAPLKITGFCRKK